MSDDQLFKKWVGEFATLARKDEIFEDLLLSPCQITAIYINQDKLGILLFRHNATKADLQIVAASTQSRQEAAHILDSKVLADSYYLEQGYVIELAGFLGRLINRYGFPQTPEPSIIELGYFKSHDINDGYVLIANVDINTDTPESIISSELPQSKTPVVQERPSAKELNCLASLWYPPLAFKDGPITLEKALVLQTEYKDHQVIFDNKSFISILAPIDPPLGQFYDKAVELMNEIIATGNLMDLPGMATTTEDVVRFSYSEDFEHPSGLGHRPQPTVRSLLFKDFFRDPTRVYEFDSFLPFRIISKSLMEDVIRKAERITESSEVKNYLLLFLDATSHMLTGGSKAAFLHGWIVIEKYIDDVWSKNLSQQGVTGNRHKKLSESILWTTDDKLEVLNLLGDLPNERYVEMMRLKKMRNGVVHKERRVHPREAQECLRLCKNIILELVRSRCFVEV